MLTVEQIETVVRETLGSDARFSAVILFGSFAKGRARASSDLDLAFVARDDDAGASIDVRELMGHLGGALLRDVQLVNLEAAGPTLRMQVFRDGRVILDRDVEKTHRLIEQTMIAWFDWEWARQHYDAHLAARFPAGSRG